MKTGIFYATSTGTTEDVARRIAKAMGVDDKDVIDVSKASPSQFGDYDLLVLGSPTYGAGEVQDDWYDMLDGARSLDLRGKKIAVFGTGDEGMSDTFCGAVGVIYDRMAQTGAEMIGHFNTYPYEFNASDAVKVEGAGAVGLLLDEVNHPEVTDSRIEEWVKTLG